MIYFVILQNFTLADSINLLCSVLRLVTSISNTSPGSDKILVSPLNKTIKNFRPKKLDTFGEIKK